MMVDKCIRVIVKFLFVILGVLLDDVIFIWVFLEFYEWYLIKILEVYWDVYVSVRIELFGSSGIKLDNMF